MPRRVVDDAGCYWDPSHSYALFAIQETHASLKRILPIWADIQVVSPGHAEYGQGNLG